MKKSANAYTRTLFALSFLVFLIAVRLVSQSSRIEDSGSVRVERPLMGTVWTIEVVHHGRLIAAQGAIDRAFGELERIDNLMSEWKPESPISRVNANAGKGMVEVPEELRSMIQRSIQYSEESDGTFDITWRGMGRIWHFDDSFVPPDPSAVEEAKKNVNYRAIQIDGNRVGLPTASMSIGLGGIAKGYAVDRAAAAIAAQGFNSYFVDGGGDILVAGSRADGEPWRFGIQDPRKNRGTLVGTVRTTSGAVVTSGDYERCRIVNGVRYHHIIDPRTGWPANQSSSVTVIAPTAELGVVAGKVIFILGADKGLAFAKQHHLDALVIDPQGKRFATDGWSHSFETQQ